MLISTVPYGDSVTHTGTLFFFWSFCLFAFSRAVPTAYAGSQARGLIRAVAAGVCQIRAASATYTTAHSNARSLNPLSKARDRTCNLMVPSQIR